MRHSVPIRGVDGPEGPTALAAALDLVRSTLEQVGWLVGWFTICFTTCLCANPDLDGY
jgi:hypothetical protein